MTAPVVPANLRFDLRVPPFAATDYAAQHAACLDMAAWADDIGIPSISVSEHHGDPAGFTSAPLTLAAAIIGRTRRVAVTVSAMLAPLHDPVRLAEQLATIDCLAPGRVSVIVGAGYRQAEFDMAGVERGDRGPLVEECVEVLRAAWTGQPFPWRDREVLVTPVPPTPGGPQLLIGGKTEAAARRAARLRCTFAPAVSDERVWRAYQEESARLGYAEARVVGTGSGPRPGFVMISRDPDRTWAEVAPHAMYDAETYASWQDDRARSDWVVPDLTEPDDLRKSGRYVVVTPGECAKLIGRDGSVTLHPLMGGIPPAMAWDSLRLFESEVLPGL